MMIVARMILHKCCRSGKVHLKILGFHSKFTEMKMVQKEVFANNVLYLILIHKQITRFLVGCSKNKAVSISSGEFLCFQDVVSLSF